MLVKFSTKNGPRASFIFDHNGIRGVNATLLEITLVMPCAALPNRLIMKLIEPRQ